MKKKDKNDLLTKSKKGKENEVFFMEEAYRLAEKGKKQGEVPVGAVVVWRGNIVGKGWNQKEKGDPTAHAELMAIRQACKKTGNWRLEEGTLYCTLEPCLMCAGAILQARIGRIVFLLEEPKFGVITSRLKIFQYPWNHTPIWEIFPSSELKEKYLRLLQNFFHTIRGKNSISSLQ